MQTMNKPGQPGGSAGHVAPVNEPRRPAPWPVEFYRSAVGKKWVMAVTGIILMGYVFAHMVGNLHIYQSAEEMNHYGEFLRELVTPIFPRTGLLWLMRVGLLAAFVFHIHAAYALTRMNRRARGGGYAGKREFQAANAASRSMRWTGVIIALFVLWHLADFTWGFVNPDFVRGDVYRNVQASLTNAVPAAIYIVANIALGLHLLHGSWSMFQSLGLNNPRYNSWRRNFAVAFAVIVTVGNLSFPLGFVSGATGDDACIEDGDRVVTCEEVFAGQIRNGELTIEEFDAMSDGERHEMREAHPTDASTAEQGEEAGE